MDEKNAVIKRDGDELKLYHAGNDEPFQENEKPVSFNDLATSVLANNKLLKVNGPAGKQAAKTHIQTEGAQGPRMDRVLGQYEKQIAELQAAASIER